MAAIGPFPVSEVLFIGRGGVAMARIQLALSVDDIAVDPEFYSKLFGAPPAKTRPGYGRVSTQHRTSAMHPPKSLIEWHHLPD
jgi:hypothetical protein